MELGACSTRLAAKDVAASRAFCAKLGFEVVGKNAEQNGLILRSGKTTIGLFQGMLEGNVLTFNPGWNEYAEELPEYQDVRAS